MKSRKNLTLSFVFLSLIVLGYSIYRDYGIGVDEPVNRKNGVVSTEYILYKFSNVIDSKIHGVSSTDKITNKNLENYTDRDYGVVFDVPALMLERALNINETDKQYQLRKILTYLYFIAGLFAIFTISAKRFNSYKYGLVAVAFMFFSPRIFGEAFYNSKDIVFMAIFTIALNQIFSYINFPTYRNAFYAGLVAAISINIRIIGIVIPLMIFGLLVLKIINKKYSLKKVVPTFFLMILTCLFFTIFLWPWLWDDPFNRFAEAFTNMSQFRINRWELFNGQFYTTSNLPWYYLPLWISITTPVTYLFLFCIGLISVIKSLLNARNIFQLSDNNIYDLALLSVIFFPVVAAVLMHSIIYNGWRHFYFIYPAIILIIMNGFDFLISTKLLIKQIKVLLVCALLFSFGYTGILMINAHPLQYVYFNKLAGSNLAKKYPMDYADLSIREGLEFLLINESDNVFKISAVGPLNLILHNLLLILPNSERLRFQLVNENEDSEYIFSDYQFFNPKDYSYFYNKIKSFNSIYNLKVDNEIVLTIFKRN
jgi:hypothetical protein